MKKNFILLIIILVAGSLAIILPYFLPVHNQNTKVSTTVDQNQDQEQKQKDKDLIQKFTSKPNTSNIPNQELTHIEGKNKIYFENIEKLNQYFKSDQVEYIKVKVQLYVHQYISNDILECKLLPETIKQTDNIILFQLSLKEVKKFEVQITKDIKGQITDIIISQSI